MEKLVINKPTDLATGLSESQVKESPANTAAQSTSKTLSRIVFEHVFTYFNIVNFILAALVIYTGSYRNILFMGIVLSNLAIGLIQEIRSKMVLDKLALVHQQKYQVLRSGKLLDVDRDQIVLGDIVVLKAGNQIPCDGVVVQGDCQVNESMLTGESDAIDKQHGDSLFAGCFVISGLCRMQAVRVGSSCYMESILKDARRSKPYPSQLRDALNKIIKFSSVLIFPVGCLLFIRLFFINHGELNASILSVVAALVGMIPEGLVILTSIALAAASVKLAKANVLVQELYCIENLARVDVLCLDKTGTITSGKMEVKSFIPLDPTQYSVAQMKADLANLYGSLTDENVTALALREALKDEPVTAKASRIFPFTSDSKCSGAVFGQDTYLTGAYSFIFENEDPLIVQKIESYARQGLRVLVLAKAPALTLLKKGNYQLLGFILIEDQIRADAPETLAYFEKQDVQIKVISGDMATTVQAIGAKAGLKGKAIDMTDVDDQQLPFLMETYSIFGRVTPEQKKKMVMALQKSGHTVAMSGDGVNDVMALKQADCSIAMGSGSQAARSVSSLVLLEDQFAALPSIVSQGRRVINNIERTASLFLVKTLFSFGLALMTMLWMTDYPFIPIQLTLVSGLGVGLPAFLLTFEPNTVRIRGNFLPHVLSRALPGALTVIVAISVTSLFRRLGLLSVEDAGFQTMCTILTGINSMCVLYLICQPLTMLRKWIVIGASILFAASVVIIPHLFSMVNLNLPEVGYVLVVGLIDVLLLLFFWYRMPWEKWLERCSFLHIKSNHA